MDEKTTFQITNRYFLTCEKDEWLIKGTAFMNTGILLKLIGFPYGKQVRTRTTVAPFTYMD